MLDLLDFVLIGMAAQRLTAIWVAPYGILTPFRLWLIGAEENARGKTLMSYGINCTLCMSLWFAGLLWALWLLKPVGELLVVLLALGCLTSIINGWTKGV